MSTGHRIASLLVLLGTTLVFGCATPTQRSADIATQEPHPSPINNFQIVVPGGVYRSGQPMGEADWNYLKDLGITTVVKLNKFSSDADETEEFRMAKARNIQVIPIYMQPEGFPHNLNPWASPDLRDLNNVFRRKRGSEFSFQTVDDQPHNTSSFCMRGWQRFFNFSPTFTLRALPTPAIMTPWRRSRRSAGRHFWYFWG